MALVSHKHSTNWRWVVLAGILFYFIYVCLGLVKDKDNHFWDFKVYYHAADTSVENPYDDKQIFAKQDWKGKKLGYKYPPITQYIFKPFRALSYTQALAAYLTLLLFAISILVTVWSKIFPLGKDPWFYVVFIMGFNASLFLALRSGNITIILSALIWLGLYHYLKKNYLYFILFISAAALFKITPVLLLSLLIFAKKKDLIKYGGLSAIILGAYFLCNYLSTTQYGYFLEGLKELTGEFGIVSPNMLALSKALSKQVFDYYLNFSHWETLGSVIYLFACMGIIAISYRFYKKHKTIVDQNRMIQICGAILIYFLILPRVKDYDFLMLAPVAYMIIRYTTLEVFYPLMFLVCVSALYITLPGVKFIIPLLWDYFPLMLVLMAWGLVITNKVKWPIVEHTTSQKDIPH